MWEKANCSSRTALGRGLGHRTAWRAKRHPGMVQDFPGMHCPSIGRLKISANQERAFNKLSVSPIRLNVRHSTTKIRLFTKYLHFRSCFCMELVLRSQFGRYHRIQWLFKHRCLKYWGCRLNHTSKPIVFLNLTHRPSHQLSLRVMAESPVA